MRSLSFPIHDAWLARIRCYCGLMLILGCTSNSKGQELTDNPTDRAIILDLGDDQFKNPAGRVRNTMIFKLRLRLLNLGSRFPFEWTGEQMTKSPKTLPVPEESQR